MSNPPDVSGRDLEPFKNSKREDEGCRPRVARSRIDWEKEMIERWKRLRKMHAEDISLKEDDAVKILANRMILPGISWSDDLENQRPFSRGETEK